MKSAYGQAGVLLSADRCRQLDLSNLLDAGTVVLVGFAEGPGPVRLCARKGSRPYRAVTPDRTWTMYRVVIPVENR
jgi:hypothetical protein